MTKLSEAFFESILKNFGKDKARQWRWSAKREKGHGVLWV